MSHEGTFSGTDTSVNRVVRPGTNLGLTQRRGHPGTTLGLDPKAWSPWHHPGTDMSERTHGGHPGNALGLDPGCQGGQSHGDARE